MCRLLENSGPFVIQKHSRPADTHWDLMLRSGETLITWRLDLPPEDLNNNTANAIKIADHPLRFLTYEGSVNNGTGSVKIAAKGTYELTTDDSEGIYVMLLSEELTGKFRLIHKQSDNWTFEPIA